MSAAKRPSRLATYLNDSRDVGASLALVVPLLLLYEITMLLLAPPVRNSAEQAFSSFVGLLSPTTFAWVRRVAAAALVAAAVVWLVARRERRDRAPLSWVFLESLGHAVILGPLVGLLVGGIGLSAVTPLAGSAVDTTGLRFLLSVGAGLWEEIVFRLGVLGGLYVLLKQGVRMQPRASAGVAILVSALLFALYHHVGATGEPFLADRFAFRAFAGTILGILFVFRGLAVVVYMHVFYDLLCDLRLVLTS